jgi:hypothetical protein
MPGNLSAMLVLQPFALDSGMKWVSAGMVYRQAFDRGAIGSC